MATINFFDILSIEPTFFEDADIDSRIDKDVLRDSILRRCGTLLPVYTDSTMFKYFSNNFFYERKNTIRKLLDTVDVEYNPIDNYDRTETIEKTSTLTAGIGSVETRTMGSGNSVTVTPSIEQEEFISAHDNNDYSPKAKTVNRGEEKRVTTQNGADTVDTVRSGEDKTIETVETRTHGNIGVITTQEMLSQERKIALFNIYNWIAIEFEQNFFICVS